MLAAREIEANLASLRAAGAYAEYHAVDALDQSALGRLIESVERRLGPIGGVVHGAGVIEDKWLADKTDASWSRVVETKVLGLLGLMHALRDHRLRFVSVFSSVAGRYGNSGQSDYATANELMNRLCCQWSHRWSGAVNVSALCWGPWGATRHGAGMITADTEAKFTAKGVTLVTAAEGRRLFRDAVLQPSDGDVEIVCGAGPWEAHEAAIGAFVGTAVPTAATPATAGSVRAGAWLLRSAEITASPTGEQRLQVLLGDDHVYLQQHRIDATPVLPAAVAMALMAEAASTLWPGWTVVDVHDFRLVKGVELKEGARTLELVVQPPPYGSSEGFEVVTVIRSALEGSRTVVHYRGVVRLEAAFADALVATPAGHHRDKMLRVDTAYDELLFHGPCFQLIESIDGISDAGATASVHRSRPSHWLSGAIPPAPADDHWLLDPGLVDAAAQMALLWSRTMRGESCLPSVFGRVTRHRETLPDRMTMAFHRLPDEDPCVVRADVDFLDLQGRPVLSIEGMTCIASAALNRLGGTERHTPLYGAALPA